MEILLERRGQVPMAPETKKASVITILQEGSASRPVFVVPRLLRIQDAAKYLSATTWQIETLLREKKILSFVLGKRRVIDRLELDRYVEFRNAEAKAALRDNTASEPLVGVSEDLEVLADKLPE
jgi:excisionase family DNA binding protein